MKLLVVHTPSHQILRDRFFLPSLQDEFELCQFEFVQEGTGRFLTEGWSRAVMFKCERIIEMILDNPGDVFVYADVDLEFFAPADAHLQRLIQNCDIVCQQDDPAGNFCTGFFALRSSPRTLALWEGVRQAIRVEGRDQLAFNRLARRYDDLKVRPLPLRFFGSGTFAGRHVTGDTRLYIPPAPIMFHANWTVGVNNKALLLDRVGKLVRGGFTALLENNACHVNSVGPNSHSEARRYDIRTPPWCDVAAHAPATSTMPTSVCLEISSACQLACPSCPTSRGDIARHLGTRLLRLEEFRQFLDGHPWVKHVELSNWGELFLNKSLVDMLRLAHARDVVLTADNGANLNLMGEGVAEALVRYGLRRLTCSIDGAGQEAYARYRVNGDFERVIDHIREINLYKTKYGSEYPHLRWQFVAFGHNQGDIAAARQTAEALGMEFYLKLSWEDLYSPPFSPVTDVKLIRRETGLDVATRGEYEQRYGRSYVAETCQQLWTMPRIHADGRLLGCSINYWGDYGNVFEDGLDACLRGEKMTYARGMVSGELPQRSDTPCSICKVYQGMRRTGNWLAPTGSVEPALVSVNDSARQLERW